MNDDFSWSDDYPIDLLTDRFERMLKEGGRSYFDAEEFEVLIDYYQHSFNNEKSRLALEFAIQQHPFNNNLRIKQARQLATENQFIPALELLNEVEPSEPNDPEILMTRGTIYSMMLEFQKAIIEYKKALRFVSGEDLADVYATIAFEYENMGKYETALAYLKKALSLQPDSEPLLYEIGMCYEVNKQLDKAVHFFTKYLDENPHSPAAWFNLGLTYHHLELYEKAIDAFEFVHAIDDHYLPLYHSMAQAYVGLELYHKAIEVYRESFEVEEPGALTYYHIGECYEKMEEYGPALINYRKAIDLDSELAEPWAGIGVVFDGEGKTKTAVRYLVRATELDPLNTEFLLILADLYIKLNDFAQAKTCFEKVEDIDPGDPDLWLEYANLYVIQRDYEGAIGLLKTGLKMQPESAAILYRLTACLLLNHNTVQAFHFLEQALEINHEQHKELIDYYPDVLKNNQFVEIIQAYCQPK